VECPFVAGHRPFANRRFATLWRHCPAKRGRSEITASARIVRSIAS
jgi:hypothetical protein